VSDDQFVLCNLISSITFELLKIEEWTIFQ